MANMKRNWIVANTGGFIIGAAAFGAIQRARIQPYFGQGLPASRAAWVEITTLTPSLAVFGLIIGTAQWIALRRGAKVAWWIPATILGWAAAGVPGGALAGAFGGGVSDVGPDVGYAATVYFGLPAGLIVGLLPGVFQWLV